MPGSKENKASAQPYVFSKTKTEALWAQFSSQGTTLKFWARQNRVLMGPLIRGMIKHFPELWEKAKDEVGELFHYKCPGCGLMFYANTVRQKLCRDACGKNVWVSRGNPAPAERAAARVPVQSPDGTENPQR